MRTLILKTKETPVVEYVTHKGFCDFCGETAPASIRSTDVGNDSGTKRGSAVDICENCAKQIVKFFEDRALIPDQMQPDEDIPSHEVPF